MGWLRFVGSFKLEFSFAEYSLLDRALLQKKLIILRSLLIVATLPHRWYMGRAETVSFVKMSYVTFMRKPCHTYAWIMAHMYIYDIYMIDIHMYTYVHMYISIHVYVHIYTCVCIYIHIHTYTYIYICIHICTYICTYIYIYIYVCAAHRQPMGCARWQRWWRRWRRG